MRAACACASGAYQQLAVGGRHGAAGVMLRAQLRRVPRALVALLLRRGLCRGFGVRELPRHRQQRPRRQVRRRRRHRLVHLQLPLRLRARRLRSYKVLRDGHHRSEQRLRVEARDDRLGLLRRPPAAQRLVHHGLEAALQRGDLLHGERGHLDGRVLDVARAVGVLERVQRLVAVALVARAARDHEGLAVAAQRVLRAALEHCHPAAPRRTRAVGGSRNDSNDPRRFCAE